ncbi:MAG TPA: alpha/beta hydrolase-fold protein [Aliidongia sp.]|nr:alpha/beta hydrolase-fold protein [Aliidongia sp.]
MPPTRNPLSPNYPPAFQLPDGKVPSIFAEGNFIIGPTHTPAPETVVQAHVPKGTVYQFTLSSNDSIIYNPGVIRDEPIGCLDSAVFGGSTFPDDPSNLILTVSHPGTWTRPLDIYVPAGYRRGVEMPFIVMGDGGPTSANEIRLFTVLDNLIHERKIPPMIAVSIGAGGQDSQGSERGREYDTVSGNYAEWVEREILPFVEQHTGVRLTKDPDGRATMGFSSSGAAAFTMAWFHPELYHRVLGYSPTMVNQQWPHDPALRGGAWEFHDPWAGAPGPDLNVTGSTITETGVPPRTPLIPTSPRKPIRYWFETGDQDLFYFDVALADGMHDWALSNELMAKALAAKGYQYQFVFSRNAKHVDAATESQTLPEALEWLWQGYPFRRVN